MREIIITTQHKDKVIEQIKSYGEIIFVSKWLNVIAFKPNTDDLSFLNNKLIDNYYDSRKGEFVKV